MASPEEHSHILRCPISKERLTGISTDILGQLNNLIERKALRRNDNSLVERQLDSGLINESGTLVYEIRGEIALLLPKTAIPFDPEERRTESIPLGAQPTLMATFSDVTKEDVQSFYNEKGWQVDKSEYGDAQLFIDRRPAVQRYQKRCASRITKALEYGGRYLLDAASGPVPYGPETDYARGYEFHVCIDISIKALEEARYNLADRGIYILADVTNMPIQSCSVDAIASLHTIYHIPKDEQYNAFIEMHRTLRTGGTAAIAYNWGRHAIAINLLTFPIQLYRFLQKRIRALRTERTSGLEKLYFHAHSHKWFVSQRWPFEYEIRTLQLVNKAFFSLYIHENLAGRRILEYISRLEDKHSRLLSKICYYPLILIRK